MFGNALLPGAMEDVGLGPVVRVPQTGARKAIVLLTPDSGITDILIILMLGDSEIPAACQCSEICSRWPSWLDGELQMGQDKRLASGYQWLPWPRRFAVLNKAAANKALAPHRSNEYGITGRRRSVMATREAAAECRTVVAVGLLVRGHLLEFQQLRQLLVQTLRKC